MASEFIVSKMENFRNFVFTHPLLPLFKEKMDLMQRVKMESLKGMKLTSVSILDLYSEFLIEHEKEKENSPLHLTQDQGWILWRQADLDKEAKQLAAIRPEKSEEEWLTVLMNDERKLLAYLNLVHQFYLRINSSSS
jgi:hypothetical protein